MAARDRKNGRGGDVVIRKEEIVERGHHGGAWKVAYADFVTAMMAFFLLLWLLNATTEAQRRGLADYFTPLNALARNTSGSGAPFAGRSPFDEGSMVSDRGAMVVVPGKSPATPQAGADSPLGPPPRGSSETRDDQAGATGQNDGAGNALKPVDQEGERAPGGGVAPKPASTPARAEFLANAGAGPLPRPESGEQPGASPRQDDAERRERAAFTQAAQQIREAIGADPVLSGLARQISVEIMPQGLRVQLLDSERQPMFASGSAEPNERARLLLRAIAPVLARLPQPLAITGHTDAAPFAAGGARSNWDLSTERANATRRVLAEFGLPDSRFYEVTGRADREPLLPTDPLAAPNRRIAILVLATAHPAPAATP